LAHWDQKNNRRLSDVVDSLGTALKPSSSPREFPYQYRSLFPITQRYTYLNHASVAPLPLPTMQAMEQQLEGVAKHGGRNFEHWEQTNVAARAAAARLINGRPEQIAFLRNTSEALSAIANGVLWRKGDNVISAAIEFPANIYPWSRLHEAFGVELRLQPEIDGRIDVDQMLALVDDRTRVLTLSWVQFGTGQRFDLERIGRFCRERDILFVVDAVQGLGAFQLDVARDYVDALAAGAHKFLLGPKGVSILYLSERARQRVEPTVIGWTSVQNFRDYVIHDGLQFREGSLPFECGTLNEVGICGVGRTLEMFLEIGPPRIEEYLLFLMGYLRTSLEERGYNVHSPRDPAETSAILVCDHPTHAAEEIHQRLDSQNIIVSVRLERLRVAPHFYNTTEEIDALVSQLPL
jgi:cysteine desulfurase/selenocysteine lyase